jgi:putative transposase
MAEHPADYPWSSYRFNALGQENDLLTPHDEYLKLGRSDELRQQAYRALFDNYISEATLEEIRQATNKAWVLGSGSFKENIEQQLKRRVSPAAKGGDRKSEAYRLKQSINRV